MYQTGLMSGSMGRKSSAIGAGMGRRYPDSAINEDVMLESSKVIKSQSELALESPPQKKYKRVRPNPNYGSDTIAKI